MQFRHIVSAAKHLAPHHRQITLRQTALISSCFRQASTLSVSSLTKDTLKTEFNIEKLTKFQRDMIEGLNEKNHIAATTLTYNGRVLSYLIPGVELVLQSIREEQDKLPGFRFLILTNTRERAHLILEQVKKLTAPYKQLTSAAITGGQSMENEINHLDFAQPEIIVATIGRVKAHMKNSNYFDNLKLVVVDNADVISKRSAADLKALFEQLPKNRKTISMSVGSGSEEKELSELDAIIFPESTPEMTISNNERELGSLKVNNGFVKCNDAKEYVGKLKTYLEENRSKKVAVFAKTVATVEFLASALANNGVYAYYVHHKQAPSLRRSIIDEFNKSPNGILIGDRIIEDSLQTKLDSVVIAEGSSSQRREVLQSYLKNNAELISFQVSPLSEGVAQGDVEKSIAVAKDVKSADEKYLSSLFSSLLLVNSEKTNKEEVVDSIVSFVQQAGLEQPKVALSTALKSGTDAILTNKKLVQAL